MTWVEIAVVVGAVALGALAKGTVGVGGPLVSIPLMASVLGIQRAVLIMVLPAIVMNSWLMYAYRRHARDARDLPAQLVMAVVGGIVGALALTGLDERPLSLALALAMVGYLVLRAVRPSFAVAPATSRYLSPVMGLAAGALQGSTGVSGPLVVTYNHGLGLGREAYVFAISAIFQIAGVGQLVAVTSLGLFDAELLLGNLVALVPTILMVPVGLWVARFLNQRTFDRVILLIIAATTVQLLVEHLPG